MALVQLHPNSWAFIRGFIILCSQLDISPTVEVFFLLFRVQTIRSAIIGLLEWGSREGSAYPFLVILQNFKGRLIKVCALVGNPYLLDGFPFYWSLHPRFQSVRRLEDLSLRE